MLWLSDVVMLWLSDVVVVTAAVVKLMWWLLQLI